jgi:hypothetical protein
MLTGISHFFNEEYLLPWWIKHHLPLFDRCIMIDYHSTDRSRAIIQELAPHWQIRTSRNIEFESHSIDAEVMDIEREFDGWKVVLNTTEFLCSRNLKRLLKNFEKQDCKAFKLRGVILVDKPDHSYSDPDPDLPLIGQRWHGFLEDSTGLFVERHRLVHCHPDGAYLPGRHHTSHNFEQLHTQALVVHCAYSPWTPSFIARKTTMRQRIPQVDIDRGWAKHHQMNLDEHEKNRQEKFDKFGVDLRKSLPFIHNVKFDGKPVGITNKIIDLLFPFDGPFNYPDIIAKNFNFRRKIVRSFKKRANKIGFNLKI